MNIYLIRKQATSVIRLSLMLTIVVGCGGATGGSGGGSGKRGTRRVSIGGLLKLPSSLSVLKSVSKSVAPAESATQGSCSLLDASLQEIATAQTADDGNFSFLVSTDNVVDNINDTTGTKVSYYIRCNIPNAKGKESVEMSTVTKSRNAVETTSSTEDFSTVKTNVDTTHTLVTMSLFRGKLNPLTATGDKAPPAVTNFDKKIDTTQQTVDEVNGRSQTTTTAKTTDSSIARLEKAMENLNTGTALSDGTSAADALYLLFNADSSTNSGTLNAMKDVLGVTTGTILGDSKSTKELEDALGVLLKNTKFNNLDVESQQALIGAITKQTPDDIVTDFLEDGFINTMTSFADALKTPSEGGSIAIADLENLLGSFLNPNLVAKSTTNSKELAVLKAAINRLIATGDFGDSKAAQFLIEGFANEKSAFWDKFVDGSGNATTAINNVIAFVEKGIGSIDTDASDNRAASASGVLNAVDATKDYVSDSDADTKADAATINTAQTINFNPNSCTNPMGGDFCVISDPNLKCGCDGDCDARGDCCADKGTVCNATELTDFLKENGQDTQTANFKDDETPTSE